MQLVRRTVKSMDISLKQLDDELESNPQALGDWHPLACSHLLGLFRI